MFQINKTSLNYLSETLISNLSDKEFKIMVKKMLTEVRRTMHKQSENFNKEI